MFKYVSHIIISDAQMSQEFDPKGKKRLFLGVDDTDNLLSRGTGFKVRELAEIIGKDCGAQVRGITRHQLLVDPRIPYTSHNSSACVDLFAEESIIAEISEAAENYLLENSASGSDAGLCFISSDQVDDQIIEFGRIAKENVVTVGDATKIGKRKAITFKGLTGDGGGVIGALAAVGLRASGNDGRFLWAKGVRELNGIYSAYDLTERTGIEIILSIDGDQIKGKDRINADSWTRPVLLNGKTTLLVERSMELDKYDWRIIGKEYIKRF